MGNTRGFRILAFVLWLVLSLVKDSHGRDVFRSRSGNVTDIATSQPVLTRDRLHEVRLYDRMKCFPKVLCTLTKSGAFTQLGKVSLNDLADGYLRLLTAFPGGPPMDLGESADKFKDDFDLGSEFMSNSPVAVHSRDDEEDEDEDDSDEKMKDENESKELLLSDPLLHHKEKLEMQKLMEELMAEEKAEALKKNPSWTSSAMSFPLKLGSSLLKDVVLPYIVGDSRRKKGGRRRRDLQNYFSNTKNKRQSGRRGVDVDKNQDPIASAMAQWNKLKSPQQCSKLFVMCPFEAWEIVSMIKLIRKS